ncbi:hypothetical protein C5167_001888 [Papaver somniferum]|uniref:YitH acetyltransferase (GNAT) domain-containing protein n=1 Tax=Papaver somniferum TaxID=3469 RepID=A0A4Y7KWL0_PAPSO|nr:uncharacterized protein LOC113307822 isoform X1 [Papaver somniferum]RZC77714.1 hypothetical protein C5167_001888 [Papaver somniferum]
MTSIRSICCNDFLEITRMSMDQLTTLGIEGIGFSPLNTSLCYMAVHSNYFLVAVSPGHRFKGYSTACIREGINNQKRCEITGTICPYGDLMETFIKTIEENADKIDKVNHLEIWTNGEHCVKLLEQLGLLAKAKGLKVIKYSRKTCQENIIRQLDHSKSGAAEATTIRGVKNWIRSASSW